MISMQQLTYKFDRLALRAQIMPFDEEHEHGVEFFMAVDYPQQIPGVALLKDLHRRVVVSEVTAHTPAGRFAKLTESTYFSAGCSRSLSCSCATSSKSDGFKESPPTSLKNSISCYVDRGGLRTRRSWWSEGELYHTLSNDLGGA